MISSSVWTADVGPVEKLIAAPVPCLVSMIRLMPGVPTIAFTSVTSVRPPRFASRNGKKRSEPSMQRYDTLAWRPPMATESPMFAPMSTTVRCE